MYRYRRHIYYVYIVTNPSRTVLYIGVTANLEMRLPQHYFNRGHFKTFAGRYNCYNLIYYDEFQYVNDAIAREKQIKKWSRKKKEDLINSKNPGWDFMNKRVCFVWPPKEKPSRF